MFGDERPELADQLRANVSRFSAYKAAYVRRELDSVAADGTMTEEERKAMTKATISQFSRWTDAELTTATARARTAKQFSEYNDPDRKELFPCLRWLPSRSAVPRSTHRRFYDRVWRKDDNFWKTNQPGTEWNCKCDIEECDDPATDNSDIEQPPVPKGLEGNPASTGEVFTDNASYIRETGRTKARKLEYNIANHVLRREAIENLHKEQGTTLQMNLIDNTPIDVVFDSKTTSHLSNDIVNGCDFLLSELCRDLKRAMRQAKLKAHEENTKRDKKPSAVEYFYYEYKIGDKAYFINVEENFVTKENRHFYRLYSITKSLRETVTYY